MDVLFFFVDEHGPALHGYDIYDKEERSSKSCKKVLSYYEWPKRLYRMSLLEPVCFVHLPALSVAKHSTLKDTFEKKRGGYLSPSASSLKKVVHRGTPRCLFLFFFALLQRHHVNKFVFLLSERVVSACLASQSHRSRRCRLHIQPPSNLLLLGSRLLLGLLRLCLLRVGVERVPCLGQLLVVAFQKL